MTPHKIIVLYGRGNLGKTRTLRMVIDILNGEPISYTTNDAQTICHYNDKTIAVATKGDKCRRVALQRIILQVPPMRHRHHRCSLTWRHARRD